MYVHMCLNTKYEKMCFHYKNSIKKHNTSNAFSHEAITAQGKKLTIPSPVQMKKKTHPIPPSPMQHLS